MSLAAGGICNGALANHRGGRHRRAYVPGAGLGRGDAGKGLARARGGVLAKAAVPFRILKGVLGAIKRMRADQPAVVVGFGGYPAIPAMAAAWRLGLPRMLHEQNGVLGRVNQLFAKRVELRKNIRMVQQARPEDEDRVREAYAGAGIGAVVQSFFDDVPDRLAEAQLFIGRSGASTVADVSIIGRPAIWVPLASAIRDEQSANARELAEAGAATVIQEAAFTPEALAAEITRIMSDPALALQMSQAALACSVPDATIRLETLVETLANARGS